VNKLDKPIDPNKIAIYIRWSTEDQSSGTTLETQSEGCKHYILSQGWNINESLIFIDEGYSGGNLDRPSITKLREFINQDKIDCVVCLKLDRLSRNIVDAVNLIQEWEGKSALKSAREQFDTDSPIGKLFFNVLASFADWERSVIKERTFSGKVKRAKEGRNSGFIYAFGYKKGQQSDFEIIPEEANLILYMGNSYLSGRGASGIAEDLNANGIKNREGKQWSGNTILYILKNKIYIGILEYGKSIRNTNKNYKQKGETSRIKNTEYSSVDSPYVPSIMTLEMFNAIQEYRKSRSVKNSKISGRTWTSEHLLSGILKCKCGYSCFGENVKKNEKFSYYNCSGKKGNGKSFCDSGLIRKDILDEKIIEKIKEKFLIKENYNEIEKIFKDKYNNEFNDLKNNIKSLESNVLSLDTQLTRIDIDYRNGSINAQTHNRLFNQVETEKNLANVRLAELKLNYENRKNNIININEIEKIPTLLEQWSSLTIFQQKNLLRKWINQIIVYKKSGKENKNIEIEITYQWQVP
jgi:site-specific DNA recombinase